jgi:tryptophan halogenase
MSFAWNRGAQVLLDSAGQPYARLQGRVLKIEGVPAELLSAIALHAGEVNAEQRIVADIAGRPDLQHVGLVLGALVEAGILTDARKAASSRRHELPDGSGNAGVDPSAQSRDDSSDASGNDGADDTTRDRSSGQAQRPRPRLIVIGNGRLAHALRDAFHSHGIAVQTLLPETFASCRTEAFLRFERERVIDGGTQRAPPAKPQKFDRTLHSAAIDELRELFASVELVVCALEGVPYRALLDVNAAAIASGRPCLFVRGSAARCLIGPTVVAGPTACLHCAILQEEPLPGALEDAREHFRAPTADDEAAGAVISDLCTACVTETQSILDRGVPELAAELIQIRAGGLRSRHPLLPAGACPSCARKSETDSGLALARMANVEAAVQIGRIWPISPEARATPAPDAYRSVGILGGGTAGYLTALALRALRPELRVTLIESSGIPIIGVGEATTPELVKFLHAKRFLGRDIVDFFRRVQPSFKLGIKFQWGLPPPYEFTFPFQRGRLLESQVYESTLNEQSLGAMLMMRDRVPLVAETGGRQRSLLHSVRFAYHLDNERFVHYLRDEARTAGIDYVDTVITDAELSADGANVSALVGEDGRRYAFDLYVDCSGFRSVLLEKKLGSPFMSYADSLFTDCAVTANVPHDGTVKPYTLAETMDSGWCWNIPFESDDHRGYVFASAFTTVDKAIDEMRAKNPRMGDPKVIKFRSGRHADWWKGNVIAMGNAYGFVEPLESTALHMLVLQLEILTTHFPASRHDEAIKTVLNGKIGRRWDALRWFLGIHYKFNRRLDTPFWRAARSDVDISGAAERVALFRERAPLSYRTSAFYTVLPPEFFSDDHSFDTLLIGQQVPARCLEPIEDAVTWQRYRTVLQAVARDALPQHEALPRLRESHADQLRAFAMRDDSWLHTWVPA